MSNNNPFPDSPEKDFIRQAAYANSILPFRKQLGRNLIYFGLPSAEMSDVLVWRDALSRVYAVEEDPSVAQEILRTAMKKGIRSQTELLELSLNEVAEFLGLEDAYTSKILSEYSQATQKKLSQLRAIGFDVINLDLCGGFLYPTEEDDSKHVSTIDNLLTHQYKNSHKFLLLLTFQVRDTGREHYESFIKNTLETLEEKGVGVSSAKSYYLDESSSNHPMHLRMMRFSIPAFILKKCYDSFKVKIKHLFYYKTFISIGFMIKRRPETGVLGSWPPTDELTDIVETDIRHIKVENGDISMTDLDYPEINN